MKTVRGEGSRRGRAGAPWLAAALLRSSAPVLLGCLWFAQAARTGGSAAAEHSILAVLDEFDRLCGRPIWPGFEPCGIPLVIFDGQRTWLVRHPNPPPEFSAGGERPSTRIFEGRHGTVRANTSVDLAGTATASAILERRAADARKLAALLLHESFHVFQGKRHPGWGANEAELFLYPVHDAAALAGRRLESEALRRALAAGNRESALAWAARALKLRRERFAHLPPG